MSNCPKCNARLKPTYMKAECPNCKVNLLYYKMDERLEADAQKAQREVDAVNRFVNILKSSSVASPILIVRLVLFFTPLASMCLTMYNDISLISLILGIINGSVQIGDVIMPLISMVLVIVLSLAVIISSLFSCTKNGLLRNLIFSIINTAVLVAFGVIIGGVGIGWYITIAIYAAEIVLHFVCNQNIKEKSE